MFWGSNYLNPQKKPHSLHLFLFQLLPWEKEPCKTDRDVCWSLKILKPELYPVSIHSNFASLWDSLLALTSKLQHYLTHSLIQADTRVLISTCLRNPLLAFLVKRTSKGLCNTIRGKKHIFLLTATENQDLMLWQNQTAV